MTPERHQQIAKLFHSALELQSDKRPAFLAQICAGDGELRREVESLIVSHAKLGSFIESPAIEVGAEIIATRLDMRMGSLGIVLTPGRSSVNCWCYQPKGMYHHSTSR